MRCWPLRLGSAVTEQGNAGGDSGHWPLATPHAPLGVFQKFQPKVVPSPGVRISVGISNPRSARTHLKPNYGSISYENSGDEIFRRVLTVEIFSGLCGTDGHDCTFTQVSMQFLALRNAAAAASSEGNQYALTNLQDLC
jgi:hypothetical protein